MLRWLRLVLRGMRRLCRLLTLLLLFTITLWPATTSAAPPESTTTTTEPSSSTTTTPTVPETSVPPSSLPGFTDWSPCEAPTNVSDWALCRSAHDTWKSREVLTVMLFTVSGLLLAVVLVLAFR